MYVIINKTCFQPAASSEAVAPSLQVTGHKQLPGEMEFGTSVEEMCLLLVL